MRSARGRIVVLISGSGSNLQALIDAAGDPAWPGEIVAVISNRAAAFGLERARRAGIATAVIDHENYASREEFDRALMAGIDEYAPELVILAGFMRILTSEFVRQYRGRLLNIHPSLLPLYPGLHTHERALAARDREAGASVHYVTEELDGGPVIVQARVPVESGDTSDSLAARVLVQEHRIYPLAARLVLEGRVQLDEAGANFDGRPLPVTGIAASAH